MKIKISLDSGANIKSCNTVEIDHEVLGFETVEEWNAADEDTKYKSVKEYWNENGLPEIFWEEVEE